MKSKSIPISKIFSSPNIYLYEPLQTLHTDQMWITYFTSLGIAKRNIIFDKVNQIVKIKDEQ